MGCGQLELARILFGKLKPDQGTLAVAGDQKAFRSTADARRAGIAFVPESRRDMLFLQEPVYKNISISILDRISSLLLKPSRERAIAARQVEQLQIRPAAVELELGMLSGGNQQKVALAKWLSYPPRLLVLCEPTRGMDVGAKNDVIHIVRDLRAQGLGHHRALDRAGDGAVARRSRHRAQARRGGARICQRTDQQGPPAWKRREETGLWRAVKA